MSRRLSMPNLFAALIISAAPVMGAGIGVTPIRQPGSALDTSLQNEAGHAVRQAAVWLAAHQNTDGSWGVSNRIRLTSLSLLSLNVAHQPGHSEAVTRAALWLDKHAADRGVDLTTQAWRLLALSNVLPESTARAHLLQGLSDAAKPLLPNASSDSARFWNEAQAAAGLGAGAPPSGAATNRLADVAAAWPPLPCDNATAWQLAHLINRVGNGQLVCDNKPLDWRRDLAQRLVNSQRSVPSGGGCWDAPDPDTRLTETAFGLLALLEL